MMLNKNDQERVTQLLTDAITVLCKNGLSYESHVSVEGLLGITLDDREVFLVKIDENVTGHRPASGVQATEYKPSAPQRMAVTSPRQRGARSRGRTLPSRGRFVGFGNRKRNLFGGVPRSTGTLNSQGGLSPEAGEPPTKMRVQGDMTHSTTPAQGDSLIEIGDDDSNPTSGSVTASNIKAEPPDYPHTMPADSTQGPDSKYTLDNETSKSLTSFLDNLMTAHSARNEAGGNGEGSTSQSASSSSPSAAGSSALSHLAQMASPKSEPPAWDQQQYDSSSIPGSSPQPQQMTPYTWNSERMGFLTRPQVGFLNHSTEEKIMSEPMYSSITGSLNVLPQKNRRKASTVRKHVNATKSNTSSDALFTMKYSCKQCRQVFSTRTGLQNHVYVKHKDMKSKPFPCDECHKAFLHSSTLLRHKKEEHLGIYRHVCVICGKGHTNKSDLQGHMVSHGAEQEFHCDICQRSFTYKKVYKAHLTNVHNIQE